VRRFDARSERVHPVSHGEIARHKVFIRTDAMHGTGNARGHHFSAADSDGALEPGRPTDVVGHDVTTIEVVHPSGAPSTGIRLSDGKNLFAYSGDTEWTEALLTIAEGADLFIIECYSYAKKIAGHVNWETLKTRLPDLHARVMVTHMSPTVLARLDEIRAAGVEIAEDGKVIDL
jgi:ribonuclease BN (tRNA processing enzyme)